MAIIKKFRIKSFKNLNSIIEFNNISLSYGNRLILDNLNFKINERFAKTQDLEPLEIMVYSIMMWNANTFIKSYKKNKKAYCFCFFYNQI